ncbi:MAG: hypothetical protein CM15mP78_03310 [Candidatus Poseidoniales archaeon]|nr:MAG: hypothetical protein CM15mP78_03310 [Candidatus Poseidoniales archaeon]
MDLQVLSDPQRPLGVDQPTLLILGRPTCDDCQAFYADLATWDSTPSAGSADAQPACTGGRGLPLAQSVDRPR